MSEERRKILYAVLEEAAAQKVHVEDWAFVEAMNTNFYDHQGKIQKQFKGDNNITLNVRNVELFEEKMNAYVDCMLQFLHEHPLFYAYDNVYYDGHQEAQEKYLMTVLWSNATPEDFENPVSFLERRIQFLKDSTVQEEKIKVDSHDCFMMDKTQIIYGVEAQHPNMETPYTFVSCVENEDGESYQLPKISFGICEKTCFIYAIQDGENHQRQDSFYKKVKRALYRANKEVEDDYFAEKMTDVSPAQVCSLALFLGYMNRKGIQQFEACSYLPMRYQAKDLILLGKQKKMEALLMNLEEPIKVKMLDEMEEAFSYADHLQENITNKFIRNFLRLQYHFKEIEITSYPGESDSALHYQTPQTLMEYDDSLITELYQKTNTPPHQSKSI